MNRFPLRLRFGALAILLVAVLSSCGKTTPKVPTDERQNKGHDQPTIAQLTLTQGTLKPGKTFSAQMSPDDVELDRVIKPSSLTRVAVRSSTPNVRLRTTLLGREHDEGA